MSTPPKPPKRLLIGAGSFADALGALRLAERLAETLAGDLGGLLVEEAVVTEVVGLPGQRVVTASGTLVVAPTRQQVRTLMEGDAKAFRDTLSGLAQSRTRNWSFERRHGDLIGGLCEAARGWDLLLLGYRETHRRAGRVVLIAPPTGASQVAPDLAEDLAKALRTDLYVLSLDADAAMPEDEGGHREQFTSDTAMLGRISRMNASAVVLDLSTGPLRTHNQLRHLLAAARCPVLVLGAAQGEPSIEHTTQIPPRYGN
ncbi:hypothetical protein [Thalassovita taeanensis]|uniref:Universal stress protein family protein n=1 Tax=Thalassovita taeanensis TaxID=657014 RepID=A0A1H9DMR2_9RHOB|nr:hypothetical protein [Thalassovita taeanensis]SEQ14711.1 hypothetical protein SAMN04488092_104213 [Thalassovita taeanensis]